MSGKNLYAAAIVFPILVLAAWSVFLQYSMWRQPRVLVAASGYDPRNLLSGRYINLQLDWDKTDCQQFSRAVCPRERFRQKYVYYVSEAEARPLEQLIAKGKYRTELQFTLPAKGAPRVVGLWLDGEPWKSKLTK